MEDIKKIENLDKNVAFYLREMCRVIDVDVDTINFSEANWFQKHEWTEKQEEDFKKWMIEDLYKKHKSKGAKETFFLIRKGTTKKQIKKVVESFLLNYGWKTKEDLK